ncbi:MAG: A/G-specific adenine glycosylase, partial [Planctomycetota bacterium]
MAFREDGCRRRGVVALSASHRDRVVVSRIEAWFAQNARRLPWRTTPRDPYVSFVAEIMLQQTQALRVAERLPEFLLRFPTFEALAQASDDAVLAVWSGLGYYSRAVRLRNAARMVVEEHGGSLPDDHAALRALPGVGAYT